MIRQRGFGFAETALPLNMRESGEIKTPRSQSWERGVTWYRQSYRSISGI